MKTESEINKQNAELLSELILNHPNLRVIALIDTEGISDDYCYMVGDINRPCIQTIAVDSEGCYYTKEDDAYEDCYHYYGCICDDWTDEELIEKADAIPWEDVIAVNVSAT